MAEIDEKRLTWSELLRWLGHDRVNKELPEPFRAWVSDHSTGYQATILAKDGDLPEIIVWRHSEWHSHIYYFNENGKIAGWQRDCEWAKPALERFFAALRERRIAAHHEYEKDQSERAEREARLKAEARAKYAEMAARSAGEGASSEAVNT